MQGYLSMRINGPSLPFGTGWATWADVASLPSSQYPPRHASAFPDPIRRAVDGERRGQLAAGGGPFENERVLMLCYTPPMEQVSKVNELFYTDQTTKRPTN